MCLPDDNVWLCAVTCFRNLSVVFVSGYKFFDSQMNVRAYTINITQTGPCIMQRLLKVVKMIIYMKKFDIFLIFAQNIYCGYTLEPPG